MKMFFLVFATILVSCKSDHTPVKSSDSEPSDDVQSEVAPSPHSTVNPVATNAEPEPSKSVQTEVATTPPAKVLPKFPIAVAVPGKPGYLINPWTKEEVDVRGIPPGALVVDPNDPNHAHKFRVP